MRSTGIWISNGHLVKIYHWIVEKIILWKKLYAEGDVLTMEIVSTVV